jgi:hypothetical protein
MGSETIFLSYSSKDRPFAMGFAKELQNLGVNVWIDQLGIKLGENWDNAIEEALEKSNTFLLLISPTSIASQNVQDEVSIAINTEKRLVPILIKKCDLPMRWQRRHYADLTEDSDKAIKDVLESFGLQEKAAKNIKNLLSLLQVSEAPKQKKDKGESGETNVEEPTGPQLGDLLISEAEIDQAIVMHKKGIKKNQYLIIFVAILSIALLAVLASIGLSLALWMIIVGCLSLNLLAIRPFGSIKKRQREIDLMDLLKLKRERLLRIMNNLKKEDIDDFNAEFEAYIAI